MAGPRLMSQMPPPAQLAGDLVLAAGLLTRLPLPRPVDAPAGAFPRAVWAFPAIGAGLGALQALAFLVAVWLLPPAIAALLAVAAGLVLTGGLHEDGLADSADGLGGRDPAARLAIMRDSRIGSFGVLALFLALGIRVLALAHLALAIGAWGAAAALVAVGAASRAGPAAAMAILPPARPDGLAAGIGRPSREVAIVALVIGAGVALVFLVPGFPLAAAPLALLAGAGTAAALAVLARDRLGGYTGDTLGALQQLADLAMLLALVACTPLAGAGA